MKTKINEIIIKLNNEANNNMGYCYRIIEVLYSFSLDQLVEGKVGRCHFLTELKKRLKVEFPDDHFWFEDYYSFINIEFKSGFNNMLFYKDQDAKVSDIIEVLKDRVNNTTFYRDIDVDKLIDDINAINELKQRIEDTGLAWYLKEEGIYE